MSILTSLAIVSLLTTAAQTESFALIVTNNRSLDGEQQDLHYADDDGVAYADLFAERFGRGHTIMLTQLDAQTKTLSPGWNSVPTPTLKNLDEAVDLLAKTVAITSQSGTTIEVFVVFAGHGNVDNGMGYLELLDGRLTATDLEERVIKKLKVSRLHLIIDSCNSYFMLNPRKPGGRRWAAESLPTGDLMARYPYVGSFISTNAEAVSYEWSELQSGVFSYEVRSGLRGAADADGNGVVSYTELLVFVERANAAIKNAQYRPRVSATGPRNDPSGTLLGAAPSGLRTLRSDGTKPRRLTIRDAQGVRLLDAHQEAGTPLTLVLPAGGAALELYERVMNESDRPTWVHRSIPPDFRGELDELSVSPEFTQPRGEAALFESLFSMPYGKEAVAQFIANPPSPVPVEYGVTKRDVERLSNHLHLLDITERQEHLASAMQGSLWGAAASNSLANTVSSLAVNAGIAGLYAVEITEPQRMYERLLKFDLTSDEGRAHAMFLTERDFARMAERAKQSRTELSILGIALGSVGAGLGIGLAIAQNRFEAAEACILGLGGAAIFSGVLGLTIVRTPSERAWDFYLKETKQEQKPAMSLELSVGPGAIGLRGNF